MKNKKPDIWPGSWPRRCVQRAFVDGAAWWLWKTKGFTPWASERDEMEDEAIKRYGHPVPDARTHGPFCGSDCACGLGNGPAAALPEGEETGWREVEQLREALSWTLSLVDSLTVIRDGARFVGGGIELVGVGPRLDRYRTLLERRQPPPSDRTMRDPQ